MNTKLIVTKQNLCSQNSYWALCFLLSYQRIWQVTAWGTIVYACLFIALNYEALIGIDIMLSSCLFKVLDDN